MDFVHEEPHQPKVEVVQYQRGIPAIKTPSRFLATTIARGDEYRADCFDLCENAVYRAPLVYSGRSCCCSEWHANLIGAPTSADWGIGLASARSNPFLCGSLYVYSQALAGSIAVLLVGRSCWAYFWRMLPSNVLGN